jgi:hypothetical protein
MVVLENVRFIYNLIGAERGLQLVFLYGERDD